MKEVIARVRLNAGNAGWFDPLTNIHLTVRKSVGEVLEGMNTSNLQAGVRAKTIILEEGSLTGPSIIYPPGEAGGDLVAPNGSVFALSIDNEGTIVTQKK